MQVNATDGPPTLDELREAVAAIIGLDPDAIPANANLVHLGLDSLGMMRIANRLRRAGIRVPTRELAAEPTLAAWRRHLVASAEPDPRGERGDRHPATDYLGADT